MGRHERGATVWIGWVTLLWSLTWAVGCGGSGTPVTEGRVEATCTGAIPVCNDRAGCRLSDDEFLRGTFPGGRKVVVRTRDGESRLLVQLRFDEMASPGTELLLRAHTPDCGDYAERRIEDTDLFERAGDDRMLEYRLSVPGTGEHLFELFSDMSADYTLAVTVED